MATTLEDLRIWTQQQSAAVQALIDKAHADRSREIAAQAVDLAWHYQARFQGPQMMPAGRKAEHAWQAMSDHARRMLVDAACTFAYGRAQTDWQ